MACTVHLPRTGQTTCWDNSGNQIPCAGTGQDGEIKAGEPWPEPRFTDNGDETMTDNLTGLMWTKMPIYQTVIKRGKRRWTMLQE